MPEFWIDLAYFIGTLVCIGLPAYALVYFDDDNAEMQMTLTPIPEEKKKKFTFIEASSGRYLIGRKDGSVQELNRKEWLKLKE